MKKMFLLAVVFATGVFGTASAQVEDPAPQDAPPAKESAPAVAAPAKASAPIAKKPDGIKGNAGADVEIVETKGECTGTMKSLAITNKSTSRSIKAAVDMLVTFRGGQSKKTVILDNLNPGEVRFIGCAGCIENRTGQTCTTYKIIVAAYK
ncbi:MAG: hypothetical protein KF744_15665 [Taibaiella sp.]|nr:hypothetical protein [Taibaiella sp.]